MPLKVRELSRTGRRSPVRHVHDLSAFAFGRAGPSARFDSTYVLQRATWRIAYQWRRTSRSLSLARISR
jgi:hypothetical protein